MFNKQTKQPAPAAPAKASPPPLDAAPMASAPGAAAPQVRKSPKMASLIADDITIEGNVIGEGELLIDGIVRGDVRVARLRHARPRFAVGNGAVLHVPDRRAALGHEAAVL